MGKDRRASFQSKCVLVIGLGLSGQSAAHYLLLQGAQVTGIDRDQELLQKDETLAKLRSQGMRTLHESEAIDINAFDLVVVSPGVPPNHPSCRAAKGAGVEVIGEVELAFCFLNQTCVGITGTNGKTTVTLLVDHVLNQSGIHAKALGNVGTPLTAAIDQSMLSESAIVVAELSSFQLETLQSQVIDAGVILNITPDHLDRYLTIEDYAKAKIHLQDCLKPAGKLFVEEAAFSKYRPLFHHRNIFTYGYGSSCDFNTDLSAVFFRGDLEFVLPSQLQGKPTHDLENVLAAYALCREMGAAPDQFCHALGSFKKPSHRIEYVRTLNGVSYFDDSKGTNIDAVIRAVNSLPGPIILIAGGVDKGFPYIPWIAHFTGKVKQVCAIGAAAQKIQNELGHCISVDLFESMEAAVRYASEMSKPGEHVLLSPGCSSYDMFKNYAHRGKEFQRIVHALSIPKDPKF